MRHTDEEERVLAAAIRKYGPRGQLIVAAEELGELQKEIFKALRGMPRKAALAEEIADVEIMLRQLKMIYGNHAEVAEERRRKVARLRARVEG